MTEFLRVRDDVDPNTTIDLELTLAEVIELMRLLIFFGDIAEFPSLESNQWFLELHEKLFSSVEEYGDVIIADN